MNSYTVGDDIQIQVLSIDKWAWIIWHRFPKDLMELGDIVQGTEDRLGLASIPDRGPNILWGKLLAPSSVDNPNNYKVDCYNTKALEKYRWRMEALFAFLDENDYQYEDVCELNDTDCIVMRGGELDIVMRRAHRKIQIWVESLPTSYCGYHVELRQIDSVSHSLGASYINTQSLSWDGPPFLERDFGGTSAASEVFEKFVDFFRSYLEEFNDES